MGALALAACGTTTTHNSGGTGATGTTGSTSSPAASPTTAAGIIVSSATVGTFGTVLVNAKDGKTLYILTSEQGGKLTCTDANGCTTYWPDTELPAGVSTATAGSGVTSSLLGTVKDSSGSLYVTYNSYPLYEYAGDAAAGTAKGQGVSSFGGTWYVIGTNGTPVSASTSSTTAAGGY
ncbi:MAG: COG4315 family predicted lipoprotein [Acidimicrobiales bacterium]